MSQERNGWKEQDRQQVLAALDRYAQAEDGSDKAAARNEFTEALDHLLEGRRGRPPVEFDGFADGEYERQRASQVSHQQTESAGLKVTLTPHKIFITNPETGVMVKITAGPNGAIHFITSSGNVVEPDFVASASDARWKISRRI